MQRTVGDVLRDWRQRRHFSQLDLASESGVSARHLSFLETGRSNPSRDLLLRLADQLELPLRERNALLLAGGFAPIFPERTLDDPDLAFVRSAVEVILTGHEPFPALAIDRHWNLVSANRAVQALLGGVSPELLKPPVNVLRMSLLPDGLASRIENLDEWRGHLIDRLHHEVVVSGDPVLEALLAELRSYPAPDRPRRSTRSRFGGVVVPLQLESDAGTLSFFSTTTVFGTAVDVTVDELTIESFFPANSETAEAMRQLLASQ